MFDWPPLTMYFFCMGKEEVLNRKMLRMGSYFLLMSFWAGFLQPVAFAYPLRPSELPRPESSINILRTSVSDFQLHNALERCVAPMVLPAWKNKRLQKGGVEYVIFERGRALRVVDRASGRYQIYSLGEGYQIKSIREFGNSAVRIELGFLKRSGADVSVYKIQGIKDRQLLHIYERLENGGVGRILRIRNLVASNAVDKEFHYGFSKTGKSLVTVFDYLTGKTLRVEFSGMKTNKSVFQFRRVLTPGAVAVLSSGNNFKDLLDKANKKSEIDLIVELRRAFFEITQSLKNLFAWSEDDGRGPPSLDEQNFFAGVWTS